MKTALVVPVLPSVTVALPIESTGPSSLRMVPVPWLSLSVALVGEVRLTTKVSLGSTTVSPRTGTAMVRVIWPGAKVSVPETAV